MIAVERGLKRTTRRLRPYLRRSPGARALRGAALTGLDSVAAALGRRDPLEPPRRLRGVGSGDFGAVGEAILRQLVEIGGLRHDARALDIGCGIGRVAIPLTGYLTEGSYEGFDIAPDMIHWCQRTLSPRFPRFRFTLVDIANSHYNPSGALSADATTFPYPDQEFDFALATSLFTHLLPSSFLNYVDELARVLAPEGTFFGTFFLIDPETGARLEGSSAALELPHRLRDAAAGAEYRAMDAATPETAVGLDRGFVIGALERAGLTVTAVHPGAWSGRPDGCSYQDILLARRSGAA
ncbi:MAG TPA: class I SAM-dependent methyltransferase [Solirubrobacteraceae bacterium]|nr:class I SAM-dependent methyltransferase [Solirubrobacteraceae bacterium]